MKKLCPIANNKVYMIGVVVLVIAATILYFVFSSGGEEVKVDVSNAKVINVINQQDKITNINEPGESIVINVEGKSNRVVVSAATNVSKVTFAGENNYVNLCIKNGARGVYAVEDKGIKNYVMTLDCPGD